MVPRSGGGAPLGAYQVLNVHTIGLGVHRAVFPSENYFEHRLCHRERAIIPHSRRIARGGGFHFFHGCHPTLAAPTRGAARTKARWEIHQRGATRISLRRQGRVADAKEMRFVIES
jgi:hypothetical protein